jgi:hypothetical protein
MIYEQTDIIKKYNFSTIITKEDTDQTCKIVSDIVGEGNYFENSPKYQTKENLFARFEPVWLKYRMSFMFSCFMYLGGEVRVKGINCWSFMTSQDDNQDRFQLWHHHHHDLTTKKISGIMYLNIPTDIDTFDTSGTEFTLGHPEKDTAFFIKPEYFSWFVYPSNLWHRPGLCPSSQNRFVLAADMEYQ